MAGKHRKPSRFVRVARRFAVIGVLAAGFLAGMAWPSDAPTYPPCATEDSPGPCYWDAQKQGNGQGRSFLVHANGTVTYR